MVKDHQVRRYLEKRRIGKTQVLAAAMAGMTAKTARSWEGRLLPSLSKGPRLWRTREDPLAGLWDTQVVPLLRGEEGHKLQATTVLAALKGEEDTTVEDSLLRTLQRRIRDWRAVEGPGKEAFFEQEHPPGRESQVDFSHGEELGVTIGGEAFAHLFFELLLSCSGWRFVGLYHGETFEALVEGTQDAFWEMGGLTEVLRSDNLSAATFDHKGKRKATKRFQAVLDHLGLTYTRINAGESNENGVVEKGHDVLKTALDQALIIRGSRDFATVEAYAAFVQGVTAQLNLKVAKAFAEECKHLRPLPACKVPAHTDMEVVVRKWSTIRVAKNTYMVSSRLIGHTVTARLRPDVVEVLYRDEIVECMPRLRGTGQHHVNYRCIIDSLVRKPGAFARYRYREDMFPTPQFRRAYAALCEFRGERADVQYVRILDLAAKTMESEVQVALELLVEQGKPFEYGDVKDLVEAKSSPRVESFTALVVPDLSQYDTLMTGEYHERIAKGSEPVPDGTPPGALHVLQVAHGGP